MWSFVFLRFGIFSLSLVPASAWSESDLVQKKYFECLSAQRRERAELIEQCAQVESGMNRAVCLAQLRSEKNANEFCKISSGMLNSDGSGLCSIEADGGKYRSAFTPPEPTRVAGLGSAKSAPALSGMPKQNGALPSNSSSASRSIEDRPVKSNGNEQAQAEADVAACANSRSQAQTCCGNPLLCASAADRAKIQQLKELAANASDPSGLAAYCQEMQATGDASAALNASLAARCTSNQVSCSNTCGNLQRKYQALLDSCDGDCTNYELYSATQASLINAAQSCNQLQVRGDTLASQGLQASSSGYASYCQQVASSGPTGSGSGLGLGLGSNLATASLPPRQAFAANGSPNCELNPPASGCGSSEVASSARALDRGVDGFSSATSSGVASKFNLNDSPSESGLNAAAANPAVQSPSTPAQVQPIQNHGAPMAASAAAPPGPSEAPVANRPSAGAPGFSTDVDHGVQSGAGGYIPAPAELQMAAATLAGGSLARNSRQPASEALDLRKYLPGGSLDPARRLAGRSWRSDINAKEEDIWGRISTKLEEKCRLGMLLGCR